MAAWSGEGIPPTRKKLHRLREQRRREQLKADKRQAAFDRWVQRRDASIREALKGVSNA